MDENGFSVLHGRTTSSAEGGEGLGTPAQELLARASSRQRVQPGDARAGAVFERVAVGSQSFFVKQLSVSYLLASRKQACAAAAEPGAPA
jgi:hypothetical protein